MKINYIKMVGFRKFENEFETPLYNVTSITGGNTKGKTNILYAIIWAFLGTNLTGDDKVWLGNKNSDGCYVELHFIDNFGNTHNLARYKNQFDSKKNLLMLDDNKAEPEDVQAFYGDKKLFLSILNPNYFINKKPAEQKELLNKYLKDVDISIVYDKLNDSEKNCLECIPKNINEYLKELNSSKIFAEDKIKNLTGKMEYAENIMNTKIDNEIVFEKEEELSLARQELSFVMSDVKSQDKEKQQKIVDNLDNQIEQLETQINELSEKMQKGKITYLTIKDKDISYCPMCKQEIKDKFKTTTIANMKLELEESFEKKKMLDNKLLDLKSLKVIEGCKLHSFDNISKEEILSKTNDIKANIDKLEQEKLEVQNHNNNISLQQKNISSAQNDIQTFRKQISEQKKIIDNILKTKKVAEKLYINYIEEKMKPATKHLKNVKIKYYSVLKESGEIKEDFIITYNDNELKNLSRSETIATSIEICNMLNIISKINAPIFIDDSESCTDYSFAEDYSKNTQILIAKVEPQADLKISEYLSESNEAELVA